VQAIDIQMSVSVSSIPKT